jgi:hypothetical protein
MCTAQQKLVTSRLTDRDTTSCYYSPVAIGCSVIPALIPLCLETALADSYVWARRVASCMFYLRAQFHYHNLRTFGRLELKWRIGNKAKTESSYVTRGRGQGSLKLGRTVVQISDGYDGKSVCPHTLILLSLRNIIKQACNGRSATPLLKKTALWLYSECSGRISIPN